MKELILTKDNTDSKMDCLRQICVLYNFLKSQGDSQGPTEWPINAYSTPSELPKERVQ